MRPLVSVITPAYNAALTLGRAHESLRGQNADWRHIIVDDGSTDGTAGVITALAGDSRVIARRRVNGGPGAALNSGLDLADGEYVAFLDADDEYLPDHLEAHVQELERRGDVDVLWGGMTVEATRPEDAYVPDMDRGTGFIHVSECVVQGTIFARRRVFDRLRFSEERAVWYQDYDFIQRARAVFAVERFHRATYRYYRGQGGSVVDGAKASWRAAGRDL